MKKSNNPAVRIGSRIASAAGASAPAQINVAKPHIGDLIGDGLWRFGKVLASAGKGGVRIAQAFGQDETNTPRQTQYTDTNHPDHPSWDRHFGRK